MSRRQTLGAISPGQLNSRASNAPARVAAKEAGGAVRSRKSMAVSAVDKNMSLLASASQASQSQAMGSQVGIDPRRSSAFGVKASGPKADPRPISDKNFQNACMRTVITYLSSHGYPAAVSPKTLSSPTAKDFTLIVQFLFQQFDPNMKTFGKIEDEVPQFFKRLNYPFQISKSALFAVGSPHSWPAVLAALTWLVELLNYNEKTAEQAISGGPGIMEDQESATKRQFFEYICTSYRYFLGGDDLRCWPNLDEAKKNRFPGGCCMYGSLVQACLMHAGAKQWMRRCSVISQSKKKLWLRHIHASRRCAPDTVHVALQ